MKMRILRWALLTTGVVFGGLGLGGCGPLGWIAALLVGAAILGGGAAAGTGT